MALDTIEVAREEIAKIYIAAFNRVPDSGGLQNWINQYMYAGMSYDAIAADFANQTEYKAKYPAYMTDSEYITEIYNNVFGRSPDAGGLQNWINQIANPTVSGITRGTVMREMLKSASVDGNSDGVRLANQAEFAVQSIIDGVPEATATAQLANITADTATVTAATAAVSGSAGSTGSTFELTSAVNTFTGTANNDTFIADNTGANTMGVADTLDGSTGTDTLKIYGFATADGVAQISNIENIILDNSAAGSTISFANTTGISSVVVQNAVGATDTTVASGVVVTLKANADATTAQVVDFGATATTASIVLDGVTTNTTVDVEAQGAAVTTLNIATANNASTVGQLEVDAAMATVVITGSKDLTITDVVEDAVNTINASAFTGKLNVSVDDASEVTNPGTVDLADITVTGGSGNDTISLAGVTTATSEMAVNAGAGDDKVTILKTATVALTLATATTAGDVINGGDGTDTLSVDGALSADLTGIVSGFEKLQITAATTMDMDANKLGITDFIIDADTTLNNLSATTTAKIAATSVDLTAALLTAGTADTLTVTLESNTTTGANIIANSHDVINIVSTKAAADAATVVNEMESSSSATAAAALNISGTQDLVIQSMALKAAATVTNTSTGALTSTFSTSIDSYVGSAAADTLSVVAGNLAQGKTFAGGAGTDSLTVTGTASQDMGILALTGFETVNFTVDTLNVMDLRNVTDLTNLVIVDVAAATDDLTVNRLSADTTLKFSTLTTGNINQVITTVNTGVTSQKVAMATGTNDVDSLTLDSGTTTLTVTFDDGDTTADEDVGEISAISGTSLATITVLGGDDANLSTIVATSVTTIDASALTGVLTVTASATGTTITGGTDADAITGGAGVDTIQGAKGADVINAGTGDTKADVIIFEATGANNGIDVLTIEAGYDVLKFTNFMSSIAVDQNGGAGTAINEYTSASASDVNITNKIAMYDDATHTLIDDASEIAALIQGSGDAFALTSGGKAILVTGDATGIDTARIWYIDDALDGVNGTVSATDVVQVAVTGAGFDVDTLTTANFFIA